jgi:hypothetical protein
MNDLQRSFAKYIKEEIIRPMLIKEGYEDDIIDSVEVTFK